MIVNEDSLDEVWRLAQSERMLGKTWVYVELVPRAYVARYVQLWEGIVGEVIGRTYYEDPSTYNPDIPERSVKALRLRVRIADIGEAVRRAKKREALETERPSPSNRIGRTAKSDTTR